MKGFSKVLSSAKKDVNYERKINLLIPEAMRLAEIRYGEHLRAGHKPSVPRKGAGHKQRRGTDGETYDYGYEYYNHDFLTQFFHEEMNRLAAKNGLRPENY